MQHDRRWERRAERRGRNPPFPRRSSEAVHRKRDVHQRGREKTGPIPFEHKQGAGEMGDGIQREGGLEDEEHPQRSR